MRKIYILISIFTLLFLSIFVISGILAPKTVSVNTITPNFIDYKLMSSATGTIKSSEKIQIKFDFDVVIAKFYKQVGDNVKPGDLLFTIDKEKTIDLLKKTYSEQELIIYKDLIDTFKLDYVSNYNGVISNINSSKIIYSGNSIVDISNGSGFIASVNVLEKDIANIEVGQIAEITGDAFNNKIYYGKVISIAEEATKSNNGNKNETTVNVILSVENKDNKLKTGYNVKANIIYASIENAATIPYEALKEDDKSCYIYKLFNKEFLYKSRVEVIAEENDYVVINGNINENTEICISNSNIDEKITRVNVVQKGIKY